MTNLIYRAFGPKPPFVSFCIWADLVLGGAAEVAKKKAEIEDFHLKTCLLMGRTPFPVQYFYEVTDYLDFQI